MRMEFEIMDLFIPFLVFLIWALTFWNCVYSVQFSRSVMSDSLRPHGLQASLSITESQSLLKLTSIESVMPSNHLILCRPLLLLPSIFPSIRVFSNESALCIRWPKYWSFNFNISPSNEHSGLISFRMDWLDLLATIWSGRYKFRMVVFLLSWFLLVYNVAVPTTVSF